MRASTRAQIQIGETIAVILVFIMLMIFGLYWLGTASSASMQQEAVQRDRLDLLETAKSVMGLPEIRCSVAGVVEEEYICVDIYRIQALQLQLENDGLTRQTYRDRFITGDRGSYALTVQALNPPPRTEYDVFNFTIGAPNASMRSVAIPVVVYDPIDDYSQFGMAVLTQEVVI